LNIGRRNVEADHQAKRIDRRMTLDSFDPRLREDKLFLPASLPNVQHEASQI
jgi:hypothetical protein